MLATKGLTVEERNNQITGFVETTYAKATATSALNG
jgi:hypothetical protein